MSKKMGFQIIDYYFQDEPSRRVIMGATQEISRLYDRLYRRGIWFPAFTNKPKLIPGRIYGIVLEEDNSGHISYAVVNADTISYMRKHCDHLNVIRWWDVLSW